MGFFTHIILAIVIMVSSSSFASTCEQDFNEVIQNAQKVDIKTNKQIAGIEIIDTIYNDVEDIINDLRIISEICEGQIKQEASKFAAYFSQRLSNLEQDNDNKSFEEKAYCFGYAYCRNGAQVSCTAFGQYCYWNVYPGGVHCVGYDRYGNRSVTYGRCW